MGAPRLARGADGSVFASAIRGGTASARGNGRVGADEYQLISKGALTLGL